MVQVHSENPSFFKLINPNKQIIYAFACVVRWELALYWGTIEPTGNFESVSVNAGLATVLKFVQILIWTVATVLFAVSLALKENKNYFILIVLL